MAYAPIILTEVGDFDEVRYLLGGVSSSVAPDAVLSSFAFLGDVETFIKNAADSWLEDGFAVIEAAGGEDWDLLRRATMQKLAAEFATGYISSRSGSGFKAGGYSEIGISVDWVTEAAKLKDKAAASLAKISVRTFSLPASWIATGPTSSGENVPEYAEEWVERVQPEQLDWIEEGGEEDDDYYE